MSRYIYIYYLIIHNLIVAEIPIVGVMSIFLERSNSRGDLTPFLCWRQTHGGKLGSGGPGTVSSKRIFRSLRPTW